ncbi:MAG: lytic transglycosylase domain-containing protein [Puniceicoccaceae bacterium]
MIWTVTVSFQSIISVLMLFLAGGCGRDAVKLVPAEEVWRAVQKEAAAANLDPGFVYAVVWAESSLNAHADSGVARGLMQLTKPAWEMVTTRRYDDAYQWRSNLKAGVAYLALNRDFLVKHQQFTYANLAAAYRYGRNRLQKEAFDLSRLPEPTNQIYRSLLGSNIWPVYPPN